MFPEYFQILSLVWIIILENSKSKEYDSLINVNIVLIQIKLYIKFHPI